MSAVKVGTKGTAAIAANRMLLGHNKFAQQTLFSNQEGVFTEDSGRAAVKMKYWLGYKTQDCTPTFGDEIRFYLLGTKRLTSAMHMRRLTRKFEKKKYICPVAGKYKIIGWPGIGTHSWIAAPNNWESDNANDAGCVEGTRIVAVADGVIGASFGPLEDGDPRFHGIRLHLITNDNEFYYAHLRSTASGIYPGARVKQGQSLGTSGHANGVAHLHIGERNGSPTRDLFRR